MKYLFFALVLSFFAPRSYAGDGWVTTDKGNRKQIVAGQYYTIDADGSRRYWWDGNGRPYMIKGYGATNSTTHNQGHVNYTIHNHSSSNATIHNYGNSNLSVYNHGRGRTTVYDSADSRTTVKSSASDSLTRELEAIERELILQRLEKRLGLR